jgi:hypothetical protein
MTDFPNRAADEFPQLQIPKIEPSFQDLMTALISRCKAVIIPR